MRNRRSWLHPNCPSAAGSEARWPPSCAALGEAHFLGVGIGTSQNTLPVGVDLIRRTPPIVLSGAFSAFSASVRNGWPRRWVRRRRWVDEGADEVANGAGEGGWGGLGRGPLRDLDPAFDHELVG